MAWTALCAMVVMAKKSNHYLRGIRVVALNRYGEAAAAGDQEAWTRLKNLATMASDEELDDRLTTSIEEFEPEKEASYEIPPDVREALGLDDAQLHFYGGVRVTYHFRPYTS